MIVPAKTWEMPVIVSLLYRRKTVKGVTFLVWVNINPPSDMGLIATDQIYSCGERMKNNKLSQL